MTREDALKLVNDWTENKNLVKHMAAVEAQMRAIAKHFGEDEEKWGLLGLVHDADYEKHPDKHPKVLIEELEKRGESEWLIKAEKAHAWKFNGMETKPSNNMEWAIYTCDELSGFIIACALVRPDPPSHKASDGQVKSSKLHELTVESIMKKWPQKSFAKGVHRDQIELCEKELGIKLEDYIAICLKALQGISDELGL